VTSHDECIHGMWPSSACTICNDKARTSMPRVNRVKRRSAAGGRKTPRNSESYFNHSWDEWFAMCDAGEAIIKKHAVEGRLTTYEELWSGIREILMKDIGSPWRQVRMLLGYIADRTYADEGLLLTALVVDDVKGGHPSAGFFRLAVQQCLLREEDAPPEGEEWVEMTPIQKTFWESQVTAVSRKLKKN
jgi:hypothetical protein